MWSDRITKLIEKALTADEIFSEWVNPSQAKELEAKYAELAKTHKGQLEILDAASHQDMDAVMYLYNRYLGLTLKVFWKYYIGPNRSLGMQKIQNGEAAEIASKAMELLAGLNTPNPYESWKPELYREDEKVDLIKQFSYWYSRYLQNECVKLRKEDTKAGITGLRSGDQVHIGSYDAINADKSSGMGDYGDYDAMDVPEDVDFAAEPEEDTGSVIEDELSEDDLAAEQNASTDTSDKSTLIRCIKDFKKYLAGRKNPVRYNIFNMKLKGLKVTEIAEELGISTQAVVILWNKIAAEWKKRYPETADMI